VLLAGLAAATVCIAILISKKWRTHESNLQLRERIVAPLFDPAKAHSLLEGPDRDRWQRPKDIVVALKLKKGERVADIGAGSGYLTPHLSRAVGPTGVVFAEEIQPEFMPSLQRWASKLPNVRPILGTAADPGLAPGSVDCFVLLTVYHEVQNPVEFLGRLKKAAASGARLAIIDFDAARRGEPPAPIGHELPEADVIAEASAAGWTLKERHEVVTSQFFLVFGL
jgi:predicted methyltransferase